MKHSAAWILALALMTALLGWGGAAGATGLPPEPLASLFHAGGSPPAGLGLRQGRLRPCGASNHCVRDDWPVADPALALAGLIPELERHPGTRIEQRQDTPTLSYLHATEESRLFGFIDDLELAAIPDTGVLQVRSESRLGDSDLGVNRRRVERLRQALEPFQPR